MGQDKKQMKPNPRMKKIILEVVDNQLRANDPPESHSTLKRLVEEGYSEKDAKELIGCAVTSEIFNIMKNREQFDLERYVAALNKLPQLPWE